MTILNLNPNVDTEDVRIRLEDFAADVAVEIRSLPKEFKDRYGRSLVKMFLSGIGATVFEEVAADVTLRPTENSEGLIDGFTAYGVITIDGLDSEEISLELARVAMPEFTTIYD